MLIQHFLLQRSHYHLYLTLWPLAFDKKADFFRLFWFLGSLGLDSLLGNDSGELGARRADQGEGGSGSWGIGWGMEEDSWRSWELMMRNYNESYYSRVDIDNIDRVARYCADILDKPLIWLIFWLFKCVFPFELITFILILYITKTLNFRFYLIQHFKTGDCSPIFTCSWLKHQKNPVFLSLFSSGIIWQEFFESFKFSIRKLMEDSNFNLLHQLSRHSRECPTNFDNFHLIVLKIHLFQNGMLVQD